MFCVNTVTFSALINNQPFGKIKSERGLRQRDPLSPFLFVMCTEGLIHKLAEAERTERLHRIQFSDEGPMIHHLLFADDSLLVCKATEEQATVLMKILEAYGIATGQKVNLLKSAITFEAKVCDETKEAVKRITGITQEGGTGTYLGLPECFSGSKTEMLAYIYDKLKDKFSGYFSRCLSHGGREILIKVVAMAMPVYAMSCFKLTKKSCENLTRAMADFWWNSLEHKRKIHWISWKRMCLSKQQGGLAFKDIQGFNHALLAKQAWRLLDQPSSLFARVLKSRYYDKSEFLSAKEGHRPSYAWRSILFGRELLLKGIRKQVGNGKSISVWSETWINDGVMRMPLMKKIMVDLELKVCDLLELVSRTWQIDKLKELFFEEDIQRILKMKPVMEEDDYWTWVDNKNGSYSVRSGYWLFDKLNITEEKVIVNALPSLNALTESVWKVETAPKIRAFMWRALSNAIPTGELLQHRGIKLDPVC